MTDEGRLFTREECIAILRFGLDMPYDSVAWEAARSAAPNKHITWREFAQKHLGQFGIAEGPRRWSFMDCLTALEIQKTP